jgi:hypothetical protein
LIVEQATCAQLFCGTHSYIMDEYGSMKTDKQFVGTLEDSICNHGALTHLVSDRAQSIISKHAMDILHALCISSWQSEPHQQHQSPMECCYNTIKSQIYVVMDHTASPAYLWLLCLLNICFLLNNMSCEAQWCDTFASVDWFYQ